MSDNLTITLDHIAGPGHTGLVKYAHKPNGKELLPDLFISKEMYDSLGQPAQIDMTLTPRPTPDAT